MTLDRVKPTQLNVIQIIHCNVGMRFFCLFTKMLICYYRYIFVFHLYYAIRVQYLLIVSRDRRATSRRHG